MLKSFLRIGVLMVCMGHAGHAAEDGQEPGAQQAQPPRRDMAVQINSEARPLLITNSHVIILVDSSQVPQNPLIRREWRSWLFQGVVQNLMFGAFCVISFANIYLYWSERNKNHLI